jgi:hypothetical protein
MINNSNARVCNECGLNKPLTDFVRDNSKPGGYRKKCKECRNLYLKNRYNKKKSQISEYQKNWRENNPDRIKQYSKKSYRNKVNKLGINEIRRISREQYWKNVSHKRKQLRESYIKHSEKRREYAKKYKKKNPHWNRMHQSNRRAWKLRAMPRWLNKNHKYQMKLMSQLARKLEEETGVKYHVDHIHPLKHENLCGLHVPWNLQVIPESENISKYNKFIPEMGLTAC